MPENDITELQTLDIYQLTENQYAELLESSEFDQNALYMTPASNAVTSVNGKIPDANGNVDTAEIWHDDEVGSLPTPINADQLEGHPSSYFQSALTTSIATVTMPANSDHVAISAPTVGGYEFMLWVNARTIGWVDGVYIENPTEVNTAVWRNNGASSPAIASGGTVTALAIYKKSWGNLWQK